MFISSIQYGNVTYGDKRAVGEFRATDLLGGLENWDSIELDDNVTSEHGGIDSWDQGNGNGQVLVSYDWVWTPCSLEAVF